MAAQPNEVGPSQCHQAVVVGNPWQERASQAKLFEEAILRWKEDLVFGTTGLKEAG